MACFAATASRSILVLVRCATKPGCLSVAYVLPVLYFELLFKAALARRLARLDDRRCAQYLRSNAPFTLRVGHLVVGREAKYCSIKFLFVVAVMFVLPMLLGAHHCALDKETNQVGILFPGQENNFGLQRRRPSPTTTKGAQ